MTTEELQQEVADLQKLVDALCEFHVGFRPDNNGQRMRRANRVLSDHVQRLRLTAQLASLDTKKPQHED